MTEAIHALQAANAALFLTLVPFLLVSIVCDGILHEHYCEIGFPWSYWRQL